MKHWLVAVAVLINGVAWWWFDSQRAFRLTAPLPEPSVAAPTVPKLLLLHEVPSAMKASEQPASTDSAPEPGAEPAPPVTRPPAEPGERQPRSQPASDPDAAIQTVVPGDCAMLGGIDHDLLLTWSDALRVAGMQVGQMIETSQQELVTGYRVYLLAGSSPRSDIEVLHDAGIDALLVVEPDTPPRISAGVFEVRSNALRRQRQLAELGYAAEIIALSRQTTIFWARVNGYAGPGARTVKLPNREYGNANPIWRPCAATAAAAAAREDIDGLGGQD